MKSNKLVTVLSIIAAVLALVLAGAIGFVWYQGTHIFIEDAVYAKSAETLDLREEDISFEHFDQLKNQLPDCSVLWNVPFQGGNVSSDAESVSVTELTEGDIEILLSYFPNLRQVDGSGCSQYAMLELLQQQAPELTVSYTVDLGGKAVDPTLEELELQPADYTYEALLENLSYLHSLKTLTLRSAELTGEQIGSLQEAYPELTVSCTVNLLGTEYDRNTTSLDLSALTHEQVADAAAQLALLPALETVELDSEEGVSSISQEDARTLIQAAPNVYFNYTFDFYGVTLNTSMEEVLIHYKKIGDEGEANVRLALDIMTGCKRFVLENCVLSNDVLAQLREDYRGRTKVVWRIYFGEGTSLTDAEILRSTYNVQDDNCHDLVYLEDVRYMDLGHNEWLDDIPFVAGMPNLEVVIISGAPIHSLEPFKNCKKLRVLEMANCLYVPDLEPLRGLESLEMLNIGFTKIKSLEPIQDLKLTHLTVLHCDVPQEEREAYKQSHPDCWTVTTGSQPYGIGWRYDENKKMLPWYEDIKNVFRYPNSPNNVGWYLKKDGE